MVKAGRKDPAKWRILLNRYLQMRDNHGVGRKKGLARIEIQRILHCKPGAASSALRKTKSEGLLSPRKLIIVHGTVRKRVGDKIRTIHVHYLPANEKEARLAHEIDQVSAVGRLEGYRERLDGLTEQFPKLVYSPVKMITKRVQLRIPFPVEEEKRKEK